MIFLLLFGSMYLSENAFYIEKGLERPGLFAVEQGLLTRVEMRGKPLASSGTFMLTKDSGSCFFYDLREKGKLCSLPFPEHSLTFLFSKQTDMDRAFIFTQKGLFIFNKTDAKWTHFGVLPSIHLLEPSLEVSSKTGLRVQFPVLIPLPDCKMLVYEEKNGEARIFDHTGHLIARKKVAKRANPILLDGKICWLNAPEEGRFSLSHVSQPFEMQETHEVSHLNRYAPVVRVDNGVWVVSFPFGFRESLKTWDTGTVELTLTFLQIKKGTLVKLTKSIDDAPLSFDLGVSSSGAPRLGVTSDFRLLKVHHSDDLLFLGKKKNCLIGVGNHNRSIDAPDKELILALKSGQRVIGWDRDLKAYVLFR